MNTSLLNPFYWLSFEPAVVEGGLGKLLLGVFLGLVLIAVVGRLVLRRAKVDKYAKQIIKRAIALCLTMGIFGAVLYFFSYEQIYLFGARFWYLVWVVVGLSWVVRVYAFASKDVPAMRKAHLKQFEKSKYLHQT